MKRSSYRAYDHAFGQRMFALRTAIGRTQASLGELLGVSRHAVGGWESGQSYPKAHHLQQIIELAIAEDVFTAGREAEEIHALWRAARQQKLLDETWLQGLLDRRETSSQSAQVQSFQHMPHNLPKLLTTLVGRAAELEMITRYIGDRDHRLITLVGVGGVGKTRLALEAASSVFNGHAGRFFRDGVYFVSFADVEIPVESGANAADIFATLVADTIRFALSGAERPYQQVIKYLRDHEILLVLDNLEHVPHLTPTILDLLQQAPMVTILATSIARLNVRGEQVVALDGLSYQASDMAATLEELPAALQLFQRAATLHNPRLQWPPEQLAIATDICARLDGIPLAIELAASLVRVLSLGEIAAELVTSSSVLHTSEGDVSPRHRSLRAVFEYSWRLLTPYERRVIGEITIFRGSFDRQAAYVVAHAELPVIAALINRSLVREITTDHGTTRYTLHTLVREYAAEMLQTGSPNEYERLAERHSRYYLGWVAARLPDLRGEHQPAVQAQIHREIDNLRVAWRWAVAHSDIPNLVAAGSALFHFYEMRSWFQEGAELFQLAAACCQSLAAENAAIVHAWAKLLARQGWLTFHLGQPDAARALLAHSLALLEPLDAPEDRAFTLNYLAAVTYHSGGYVEAQRLAHEALDTSERSGDQHGIVVAKTILGQIAYLTGEYEEARRWSLESLALEKTLGNRWGTVFTLISLGRVAVALRAYPEARGWFEQGLAIREMMGDARGIGLCLSYLGDVAAALGEYPEAERQYQASLLRFQQIHNRAGMAMALIKLGAVTLATGNRQRARSLLQEALEIAWAIQALPATLDALAGLTDVLVLDEPALATELAAIVVQHPATTQSSKRQAAVAWARLASHYPSRDQDPHDALVALMPQLLAIPTT